MPLENEEKEEIVWRQTAMMGLTPTESGVNLILKLSTIGNDLHHSSLDLINSISERTVR